MWSNCLVGPRGRSREPGDEGVRDRIEIAGLLDSLILRAGDLLHQIDDRTSKFWVWNLHESFGEMEPVGRCEIV